MSYGLCLSDPVSGERLQAKETHDLRGGTYAVGGTRDLWINATYNYAEHFRTALGESGIRTIYGMTGEASIPVLEAAIAQLSGVPDADYWAATEGNARAALQNVLALAHLGPHGVWQGD